MKYGMLIYKIYKPPKKIYNKAHNKGLNKKNQTLKKQFKIK